LLAEDLPDQPVPVDLKLLEQTHASS